MKGGVGKTTLAVNLAWHFYQNENARVLLVDLDPQFNATQYVLDYKTFEAHRKKSGTITNLLVDQPSMSLKNDKAKKNPASVFHTLLKTGSKYFDLLPAELSLAWVVKNPAQMEHRLEKILQKVSGKYDYIFIDCAPTDSVLTTMALTASDFVLIPMRPDRFSILGFTNLMETIEIFRQNCPDPHEVKVLGVTFTQVTDDSTVEAQSMSEIKRVALSEGTYLFNSQLKYSRSFLRSVSDQTPVFNTAHARSKSRTAIAKIAAELTQQTNVLTTSGIKTVPLVTKTKKGKKA
jgi:chromosome partitioning protein